MQIMPINNYNNYNKYSNKVSFKDLLADSTFKQSSLLDKFLDMGSTPSYKSICISWSLSSTFLQAQVEEDLWHLYHKMNIDVDWTPIIRSKKTLGNTD